MRAHVPKWWCISMYFKLLYAVIPSVYFYTCCYTLITMFICPHTCAVVTTVKCSRFFFMLLWLKMPYVVGFHGVWGGSSECCYRSRAGNNTKADSSTSQTNSNSLTGIRHHTLMIYGTTRAFPFNLHLRQHHFLLVDKVDLSLQPHPRRNDNWFAGYFLLPVS